MQSPTDPHEPGWGYDGDDDDDDLDDLDDGDPANQAEEIGHRPQPRGTGATTALSDQSNSHANHSSLSVKVWHPEPVEPPEVDADLTRMPWPERAAEVIRYSTLRLERWVSSNGALREWIRLNLRVGIVALAVALLVVPPVTMLLKGGSEWSSLLKSTLLNVSDTVSGMPPIVIALGALLIGGRFFQRRWQNRRQRAGYRERDPYDM